MEPEVRANLLILQGFSAPRNNMNWFYIGSNIQKNTKYLTILEAYKQTQSGAGSMEVLDLFANPCKSLEWQQK